MSEKKKNDPEENEAILANLHSIPGNNVCADCRTPGISFLNFIDPDWCSLNLGILICIDCSGIHRSLGVQYSKVRSLKLDFVDPELITVNCILIAGHKLDWKFKFTFNI